MVSPELTELTNRLGEYKSNLRKLSSDPICSGSRDCSVPRDEAITLRQPAVMDGLVSQRPRRADISICTN